MKKTLKSLMSLIPFIEDDGEEIKRETIDEANGNKNAGVAITYKYEGSQFEIVTWLDNAEEHKAGTQAIHEIPEVAE